MSVSIQNNRFPATGDDQDDQNLILHCYEIIKSQKQHIQQLQQDISIKDTKISQLKSKCKSSGTNTIKIDNQLRQYQNQLFQEQFRQQMKNIVSKYQSVVHQNQKLIIIIQDKEQNIRKLQQQNQQLNKSVIQATIIVQSIKQAYQVKFEKLSKQIREQSLKQYKQKQNYMRESRERAKSRVHNFVYANSNKTGNKDTHYTRTPISKVFYTNQEDKQDKYEKYGKILGTCSKTLMNTPYLNKNNDSESKIRRHNFTTPTKQIQKLDYEFKFDSEQNIKEYIPDEQNPEDIRQEELYDLKKSRQSSEENHQKTTKIGIKKLLKQLQGKMKRFGEDCSLDN